MNNAIVLWEHLTISLLPWLPGVFLGGALGYILARSVRNILTQSPDLKNLSLLLPWRTAAILLATMAVFTPYPILIFGPGRTAGFASIFTLVFGLAIAFTASVYLDHWYPAPISARIVGIGRTLGVVSVVAGILAGFSGAGGAWELIWTGMLDFDYARMWTGYAIVAGIALVFDLLLGAIQMLIARRTVSTVIS